MRTATIDSKSWPKELGRYTIEVSLSKSVASGAKLPVILTTGRMDEVWSDSKGPSVSVRIAGEKRDVVGQ